MPVSLIHYHLMSLFDRFPRLLECSKALLNAFQMTPARPHSVSPCSVSVTIVIGQSLLLLLLLLIHLVGLDAR
ncbi:uncharacterized protein ARMOST_12685 [Armillaria ostoyae]|uniref:Uncharacterized protein n=1 Tax=Armillaria ostoyae TaxID=47428 RepID=A0A284RKN3_ARMOS|nr:uncharacterized protein ARMOST_12685 [Armillaria ostoyae]